MEIPVKRRFFLWGGYRLEPSRLQEVLGMPRERAAMRSAEDRAAAELARLEQQLEEHGAGLGV